MLVLRLRGGSSGSMPSFGTPSFFCDPLNCWVNNPNPTVVAGPTAGDIFLAIAGFGLLIFLEKDGYLKSRLSELFVSLAFPIPSPSEELLCRPPPPTPAIEKWKQDIKELEVLLAKGKGRNLKPSISFAELERIEEAFNTRDF